MRIDRRFASNTVLRRTKDSGSSGEDATGDGPRREARGQHRDEDAEGLVPLLPFREGGGEDGERGRCRHRGGNPLDSAGDDQDEKGWREPRGQGAEGKPDDADDED